MGGGDWNDGMDRVEGKDKVRVCIGWFMYKVLKDFAYICNMRQDYDRVRVLEDIGEIT